MVNKLTRMTNCGIISRKAVLGKDTLLQNHKSNNTAQSTLSEDIIDKFNVLKTLVDP